MLVPRIKKLHRYNDHDSQMTPIDFQVTSQDVRQQGRRIDSKTSDGVMSRQDRKSGGRRLDRTLPSTGSCPI
ncbi:hypothetical protein DPMN_006609 [Dreissena polymorpha]|uniref:Uncharacterized protein n=1 Tax=Dreissena polymorpha TaxID=45954 RepID=A0A9D4MSQ6_DREPO|nr:hypothetical protein DPMN_006609 [Dreissena polymorpha]